MTAKGKEVMTLPSEEALAQLRQSYPTEPAMNRVLLPRLSMVSQDVMEGKGRSKKVVTEAGTFFFETQGEEVNEETKQKEWEKEEIGDSVEGIILYQRKQLKYYDKDANKYTSSPVYDADDEVVPLFLDRKEVDRGTPKELKAKYPGKSSKGKTISLLEETRVLYVLVGETVYQLNLRGTSMYAFLTYARKVTPPAVVTNFSSEPKENGTTEWNQMTFDVVRSVSAEEIKDVQERIDNIRHSITAEKEFYAGMEEAKPKSEEDDDF
jgi:hypothetical protein